MKTIQEMAREAGGYDSPQYPNNLVMDFHDLERFVKLVEAPLRSDIEELLQENKLLRARNDRIEAGKETDAYNRKLRQQLEQEWVDLRKLREAEQPPQRTWVGLTAEDVSAFTDVLDGWSVAQVHAVEAKLKEKNSCLN